jgi:quinol---cytochrome-c reductase cytochrome b subunit
VIRAIVRFVDRRSGTAPLVRKSLRYLFPDHWSFLLGEVALYAFIVLVATGTYLALFFTDSTAKVTYHGPYEPLQGQEMTEAYRSVLNISTTVKAGLLIRQTHHWAANVFLAAIALHVLRIFFTGAYRKPRELTYWIGLTILFTALLEGYLGYSLGDDLLSGMGLAIGYSVALSIPFVGANLASLIWDGPFPGQHVFFARMYIAHVFLLPALIGLLLTLHLALVALRHHTQFRGRRQTERKLVGVPAFPGQAPRSVGLLLATTGLLFLLGGLVQINPIWLWGPYHTYISTNGAQPDWYLGWLIGALRLMPGFDVTIGHYTLVPNPFWGGALFPLLVAAFLYLWPWLERRFVGGDDEYHNLLDRPRDSPWRTAIGCGVLTWIFLIFVAGSADRVDVLFDWSYHEQIQVYRVLVWVAPFIVGAIAYRTCVELQAGERR